ncbi:MAG: RusA family crossover junction endodeoxyribonuclease [Victivallales bacterium]|nr:RusA family crossover junction endodeoxyribonuclease [Victivallales bacterium]
MLRMEFAGDPRAVQSFRFTTDKIRYQPKEVVEWKNYIRIDCKRQLPRGFKIYNCPLRVEVDFMFSALKSWPKKKKQALDAGALIYKITKPDLTDNLMKGLIDALSGVVWTADQQICEVSTRKFYVAEAKTILTVYPLEEINMPADMLSAGWV